MPIPELICPTCASRLKRPDWLREGQLLQCPLCNAAFRAGGEEERITNRKPAPQAVDELEIIDEPPVEELVVLDDGEPRPRKKMKESERMKRAYLGLGFVYAKFICLIVGMLFMGLTSIALFFSSGGILVGCLSLPLAAATPLLGLIGALLCFWVPKRSRSRLHIQVSFGLDAGSILAAGLGMALFLIGGVIGIVGVSLLFLSSVASIVACLLFMQFLRALAYYPRDKGTANESEGVMVLWLLVTVGPMVLAPLVTGVGALGKSILGVCLLVVIDPLSFILFIYFFKVQLRMLNLIAAVRQRIVSRYDFD